MSLTAIRKWPWRSAALVGASFLRTTAGPAQLALPPDINFFSDDLPAQNQRLVGRMIASDAEKGSPKAAPGYSQVLVFQDGRELRGELVAITADEITWRRPDASEPLRAARAEVRRIAMAAALRPPGNNYSSRPSAPENKTGNEKPVPVTLKLPGGDWLFGDVASTDGQTFQVQLEDGTPLPVARPQIEWMQFGKAPTPAFGFAGSLLDMEGWLPASPAMELAGGALVVKGQSWIGRRISPPDRFEIAFELPEKGEEGVRLWLQTFGPRPNSYSTGTAQIRFGAKDISRILYVDDLKSENTPLPSEALEEKGPVKYRVFYDRTEKRLIVQRNGRQVGDWKYAASKDNPATEERMRSFKFTSLCFDRENRGQGDAVLRFNRLHFQPWDGVVPKESEADDGQDRLTGAGTAPLVGKLESVTEEELGFSGKPQPRQAGAFVRFSGPPNAGLAGAEAKLEFGKQGEFAARHLDLHDGRLHCETSFAGTLEMPAGALQRVPFPAQTPPAPSPTDLLVFKNGDELSGKALSATLPGAVRWRTALGQEVEFQPEGIAGLRLAVTEKEPGAKGPAPAAMAELRTGERLRGKLLGLDEKHARLEHPQFGVLALERKQLWHLFPNPRFDAIDGGRAPGGWTWGSQTPGRALGDPGHWICLDGAYLLRSDPNSSGMNSYDMPGWAHDIDRGLERFEVRVEATAPFGNSANFHVSLTGDSGAALNAVVSYSELEVNVTNPKARGGGMGHEVQLDEKAGNVNVRRALRLFVDTKTGSCDVLLNGVHLLRLGRDEGERLLTSHYRVRLQPYYNSEPVILSNIWIGPWTGELPRSTEPAVETTALANGDLAPGIPKTIRDGKLTIDSELGELQFPVEKALVLDFGGAMEPPPAAARVRLTDGTIVDVDRFQWDDQGLTAHSASFGDLRLPRDAVAELIFAPAPPHAPLVGGPKKSGQDARPDKAPATPGAQ